ncbi:MAG: PTS sugar transporter subunit IIA [Proteobacteria bacterium]|nr:PTS sugar transporter subunit IIA [Pseudomonadota bacterium]MBW3617853.1 PTS sugar transporter subunit IIA [Pseudomonadota bacterium]
MDLGGLLPRSAVSARVSVNSKRQALSLAAETAARNVGLPVGMVQAALLEREAVGSTGVGDGVALPHARLPGLDRLQAVFIRLDAPVPFGALDDQPVDLMCVLLVPAEAPGAEHIQALAKLARLLRQPRLREQIRKAQGADAIHALLVQSAQPSAA